MPEKIISDEKMNFTVNHLTLWKGTCNMKCIGPDTWKFVMNDLKSLRTYTCLVYGEYDQHVRFVRPGE